MDKHVDVNEVAAEAVDTKKSGPTAVRRADLQLVRKRNHSGKERTYSW